MLKSEEKHPNQRIRTAVACNRANEVAECLAEGADPNLEVPDRITLLRLALADSRKAVLRHLLDYGARVDAVDNDRTCILHDVAIWARCGVPNACELLDILLEYDSNNAFRELRNKYGRTPYEILSPELQLEYAAKERMREVAAREKALEQQRSPDPDEAIQEDANPSDAVRNTGFFASAQGFFHSITGHGASAAADATREADSTELYPLGPTAGKAKRE